MAGEWLRGRGGVVGLEGGWTLLSVLGKASAAAPVQPQCSSTSSSQCSPGAALVQLPGAFALLLSGLLPLAWAAAARKKGDIVWVAPFTPARRRLLSPGFVATGAGLGGGPALGQPWGC